MWDNRCKIAVSGVGYSKVSRLADVPLAAHALAAVKDAVADSGLQMADIDGLATYPELPATAAASKPSARRLLRATIIYLPALFALMMANSGG